MNEQDDPTTITKGDKVREDASNTEQQQDGVNNDNDDDDNNGSIRPDNDLC